MFVPCPHCGFLVALIVSRDGAAQHCPRCEGLMQLDEDGQLLDTGDDATPADVPLEPVNTIDATPASTPTPVAAPTPAPASEPAAAPAKPRRLAPAFARARAPRPASRRRRAEWLAICALALVLVVQLLMSQRAALAASASWRPVIVGACTVLRCEVPAWREPTAFTMLARNVEQAGAPGVLAVTASFRNDARWPQPWPSLRLGLSDVDGITVAARVFAPVDYRGADAGGDALIAPGQSANVRFEVVEPAPDIVAFTFDFR